MIMDNHEIVYPATVYDCEDARELTSKTQKNHVLCSLNSDGDYPVVPIPKELLKHVYYVQPPRMHQVPEVEVPF
jgi:hypothetical protein